MIQKAAETKLLFKDMGGAIVYTPNGGDAVSSYAILKESGEVMTVDGVSVVADDPVLVLLKSDISRPARDASVVYTDPEDSTETTYLIDEIISEDSHTTTVTAREQ